MIVVLWEDTGKKKVLNKPVNNDQATKNNELRFYDLFHNSGKWLVN